MPFGAVSTLLYTLQIRIASNALKVQLFHLLVWLCKTFASQKIWDATF